MTKSFYHELQIISLYNEWKQICLSLAMIINEFLIFERRTFFLINRHSVKNLSFFCQHTHDQRQLSRQ